MRKVRLYKVKYHSDVSYRYCLLSVQVRGVREGGILGKGEGLREGWRWLCKAHQSGARSAQGCRSHCSCSFQVRGVSA